MSDTGKKTIIDGCTAATYAAYSLSEVATVYPITPVAEMGQLAQIWAMKGVVNVWGNTLDVREMESELGAAGATHGALSAGALATTFTNSQGLILMYGNMFKVSGELLPGVFHVGCRSLSTHALSIFGDHQDVMAMRPTGFTILNSCSVQETIDLGVVAHLSAIKGSLPVLHFFDGWRTSNEMDSVELIDTKDIAPLVDKKAVEKFRERGMSPDRPNGRGSCQGPDVYFQNREASNNLYDAFPGIVEEYIEKISQITGRKYSLYEYVGDPEAEYVMVAMGSSCEVIEETLPELAKRGIKAGLLKVRLFRPFVGEKVLEAIPTTVRKIAVMDRTKEPGADGEPLFQDIACAFQSTDRKVEIYGGRYGLSSKEFDPTMVLVVFEALKNGTAKKHFTVGIEDDVSNLSIAIPQEPLLIDHPEMTQAIFYGIGADGTVGGTKQIAKIIADKTGKNAQAYFNYSAKKSGGYTISQLRLSDMPIKSAYQIKQADFVFCNKANYVERFPLLRDIKPGGTFVLNSEWNSLSDMEKKLPAGLKREIATKKIRLYNVDATAIAGKENLGQRINMVMETAFMKLSGVMQMTDAIQALKDDVATSYGHEGQNVVAENVAAIDAAANAIVEIKYPDEWVDAKDLEASETKIDESIANPVLSEFIERNSKVCMALEGDKLPVSAFTPDGVLPPGTTAYERRKIAIEVPVWDIDKCIECTECSLVCSHATIRPFLLSADERKAAPAALTSKPTKGNPALAPFEFRIQVFPESCTGCGSCATICPGHALTMVPIDTQDSAQTPLSEYARKNITMKDKLLPRTTVKGTQLQQPLFEFSGACGGCGETPYIKLLTQLFGERLVMANATGCSSVYGMYYPSNPYCARYDGKGPAWANSLFEDNAEYGFGILTALEHRMKATGAKERPTVWCLGGDGWAYDIGFAGLDHVLAQNKNINILVLDTECYSNTGGQASKATPLGSMAKYTPEGKRTVKKDLGRMMMTYGDIYVAQIALGANYQQAIDALNEAEAYPGASLVIAYCPCIEHGIRTGMGTTIVEEKKAVENGYWPLYRYNPANKEQPLTLDSPQPKFDKSAFSEFLNGEDRYADLTVKMPQEAATLQSELEGRCASIHDLLEGESKLAGI